MFYRVAATLGYAVRLEPTTAADGTPLADHLAGRASDPPERARLVALRAAWGATTTAYLLTWTGYGRFRVAYALLAYPDHFHAVYRSIILAREKVAPALLEQCFLAAMDRYRAIPTQYSCDVTPTAAHLRLERACLRRHVRPLNPEQLAGVIAERLRALLADRPHLAPGATAAPAV
jgi:hypothetical protein